MYLFILICISAAMTLNSGHMGIKIRQHYKYDCGAACLASVASFYGIQESLANIRIHCGCTPEGISIQGIMDGAKKLGLNAKGYKSANKDLSPIKDIQIPVIAHIKDNGGFFHFVVIYGIKNDRIKIMDPAYGELKETGIEEFTNNWTGYVITVLPGAAPGKGAIGKTPLIYHLLALLKSFYKEIALSFAGSLACTFAGISTSFLLQQFIDQIAPTGNRIAMVALGILAFALMILPLYAGWAATGYLIRCSLKIETSLLGGYMEKVLEQPALFFRNYQTGDISSRSDDIHNIRSFMTEGTLGILTSIVTLAVSLIAMALYNPSLTLYVSLAVPAYCALYMISRRIHRKYSREIANANAALESDVLEAIASDTCIRHYGTHPLVHRQIGRSLVALMGRLHRSANAVNLYETLVQAISKGVVCMVLIIGANYVTKGKMSIGELVGFYTLCTFFTYPLNSLIEISEKISRTRVSFERIFEIMDLPDNESPNEKISPKGICGDISVNGIEFRFPGRETLLHNLSFIARKGEATLLKGESGCGKSTVAQLILGDLAPNEGNITYGGISIALFNIREWREMTGYVPQHTRLLKGSIMDNITAGEEAPDMQKIMEICRLLGLEKLLGRLPEGLLAIVSNGGEGLSGGERQKIAIARALYKDPEIFVFDEPTSSLDPASERQVLEAIRLLKRKGKTIILISHKEMSLNIADNVVKID